MVDRKEVQAGDDALGADDNDAGQQGVISTELGALSPEEQAQFDEMQANSGRPAEIVQDGDPDDAQAAADAAAKAAAGQQGQQDQQQDDQDGDDDDGEPDPAAAQQGADDVDPTQNGKFPQRVNYRKYKREMDRRSEAEKALAAERDKNARIDERLKLMIEAMNGQGQQQQRQDQQQQDGDEEDLGPMPDPNVDIFKFAEWQAKKNVQLERALNGVTTHVVGTRADQTLERQYMGDIQAFAKTAPDFPQAYQHMMATRMVELALQQYDVDLTEEGSALTREQYDAISAQVVNEEKRLAAAAIRQGKSPAKVLYGMAKARGYRKAAAPAQDQQQQNGQQQAAKPGNGATQNGAQSGQRRSPVSEAVAAARKAAETNKSLSDAGGAPETNLTAQQVVSMNDEDFARFMATASPERIREVLGQ